MARPRHARQAGQVMRNTPVAFVRVPPDDDVALGDGGGVSNGVLDSARFDKTNVLVTIETFFKDPAPSLGTLPREASVMFLEATILGAWDYNGTASTALCATSDLL